MNGWYDHYRSVTVSPSFVCDECYLFSHTDAQCHSAGNLPFWLVGDNASAPYVAACSALCAYVFFFLLSNHHLFYAVIFLCLLQSFLQPVSRFPQAERIDSHPRRKEEAPVHGVQRAPKCSAQQQRENEGKSTHTQTLSDGPSSVLAVIEDGVQADGDSSLAMISSLSVL